MKEIPLRERIVAAAKPREENQRAEEILLSDWTLAAVKQREEDRRRKAQVEPTLVGLKPKKENQRAEEIFSIDSILGVVKQKEEEEERLKKEQAAEAAVVTMKRAEVAEARIVHEEAEAARRAKDEPREREEAETVLRAVEDRRQRERKETRAVPKSGIVHSGGTARMIKGILSTLTTVVIASAIGFGAGIYITPPDKADEFRALVNSKVDEINGLMHREWAAIEPKAKGPTQEAAPTEPEVVPKEIQSAVPAQSESEAPAADTTGQKDVLDNNAIRPSVSPTESSNSQSPLAPAPSAEPVVPFMSATPPKTENFEQAKPVAKKVPIAKPHPKVPVKKPKPKPKPKPAEHHPKAEPAEQAPAAEEPAQQ